MPSWLISLGHTEKLGNAWKPLNKRCRTCEKTTDTSDWSSTHADAAIDVECSEAACHLRGAQPVRDTIGTPPSAHSRNSLIYLVQFRSSTLLHSPTTRIVSTSGPVAGI